MLAVVAKCSGIKNRIQMFCLWTYAKNVVLCAMVVYFEVSPDIMADFRHIPFPDESFHMVVFDPPHLKYAGQKSYMRLKYGQLEKNWQEQIKQGFSECWRVLKLHGTLVFKWSESQVNLSEIIPLMPDKPLFGNNGRGKTKPSTHWMVFFKSEKEGER